MSGRPSSPETSDLPAGSISLSPLAEPIVLATETNVIEMLPFPVAELNITYNVTPLNNLLTPILAVKPSLSGIEEYKKMLAESSEGPAGIISSLFADIYESDIKTTNVDLTATAKEITKGIESMLASLAKNDAMNEKIYKDWLDAQSDASTHYAASAGTTAPVLEDASSLSGASTTPVDEV